MKHKHLYLLFALFAALFFTACSSSSDDDVYNQLPARITSFISQYYPNTAVSTYTPTATGYKIVLKDGPTMIFNTDCEWTTLDGNGSVLVQNFLFDQLPPEVYEYLQQTDDVGSVFSVTRTSKHYTVTLLNNILTYDISTGEITGSGAATAR